MPTSAKQLQEHARQLKHWERAEADNAEDDVKLAFDALLYRLMVMGEAVKALPEELVALQPGVPWQEIARLRDLLAHHYYRVDAQVIRRTVEVPLDELTVAVARLINVEQESQQQAHDAGESGAGS